ncbi:MAG TPA: hypothetical protein VI728_02220, partial [Syntrophales bacterium]|nr:hypothetical protein [Syntrophales bacterium]
MAILRIEHLLIGCSPNFRPAPLSGANAGFPEESITESGAGRGVPKRRLGRASYIKDIFLA